MKLCIIIHVYIIQYYSRIYNTSLSLKREKIEILPHFLRSYFTRKSPIEEIISLLKEYMHTRNHHFHKTFATLSRIVARRIRSYSHNRASQSRDPYF